MTYTITELTLNIPKCVVVIFRGVVRLHGPPCTNYVVQSAVVAGLLFTRDQTTLLPAVE